MLEPKDTHSPRIDDRAVGERRPVFLPLYEERAGAVRRDGEVAHLAAERHRRTARSHDGEHTKPLGTGSRRVDLVLLGA